MQIDDRALNFIKKAKAAGFSQQEVYDELLAKGYEIGAPRVEQTTETEQSPYSTMDKAKYFFRAVGESAPWGMGDLVAGVVGAHARNLADVTHGKDLKTRAKGLGKLAFGIVSPKDFKKERADFIKEQEEFTKHHPWINAAGEFVGGALTGGVGVAKNVIGKQGIKALIGAGTREGSKFGAAYGAGSALTQDTDKISVPEALKGGLVGGAGGAVFGAALPPVAMVAGKALGAGVKGAKAIGGKIAKILKKDASKVNQALGNAGYVATDLAPENKVFLNLLEANPEGTMEAVKAGEPLVAHANRKQLRRTRGAVTADEGADQTFIEAKRAFDQGKIQKGEDISDRLLSKESGYTATERIADEAHNKYQPLYEEVMKAGEIELPQEIIANETILGAIQEAQGRAGYTKLKANNVRVLDKAKRVLQDKFKSLQRAGKNDEAREYQLAKEELVTFLDSKLPKYKEARNAFMEGQELQEFVDLGRKLKNISHAEVERIAKTLTPEQQQALKAGIGDSVRESLYNTRSEGTNVLDKAFPAPLRRKMQALGIKDEEIANEIAKEIQTNANYQFIGGGSNTMNKAYDAESVGKLGPIVRTIKAIKSPLTTLEKAADKLDNKLAGLDSEEIARLMFDPKALAEEASKPQHQRKIAEILRKSKQETGQSISGYLGGKLKEKGGFAMGNKPISKLASEKPSQLKKDLKVLGYKKDVFYNDEIHAPSENALNKIQAYKDIVDGKHFSGSLIDLGETPQKLLEGGVPNNNLYINYSVISKAQGGKNAGHDLSKDVLKEVPEKLYNPIAVLDSRNKLGGSVVVTELKDKTGKPVIAAIRLDKTPNGLVVNDIKSIHGRESFDEMFGFSLDEGKLRKIDLKKMENIPSTYRAIIARGSKYSPNHSIVDDKGNVKSNFLKVAGALRHTTNSEGEAIAKRKFGLSNFWDFFKKSKIVDEQGRPLKVFHASDADFDTFDMSKGRINMDIKGAFFSPWELDAKGYGKNVRAFYLNIKNPADEQTAYKALRKYQGQNGAGEKAKQDLIRQGYDGVNNHNEEFIAFYPEQIKSVDNVGTFSPKTGNVYKSLIGGLGISQILKSKENK